MLDHELTSSRERPAGGKLSDIVTARGSRVEELGEGVPP